MKVKTNKVFQVLKGEFAISKPTNSYTLKVSVDGNQFESKQENISTAVFVNSVPNCFYKLESSATEELYIQY